MWETMNEDRLECKTMLDLILLALYEMDPHIFFSPAFSLQVLIFRDCELRVIIPKPMVVIRYILL